MIENVPKAEDLLAISLRLYFKAWGDLALIVSEWKDVYGETPPRPGADPNQFRLFWEWQVFLTDAQSDIQAAYTLIQQSQEIALKARIAAVSPYLLLKRVDRKPSEVPPVIGLTPRSRSPRQVRPLLCPPSNDAGGG